MKGVDAIFHVATARNFICEDPEEIIRPAVDGTKNILTSARMFGKSVKRVVVTSSGGAVWNFTEPGCHTFDESSWNETVLKEVEAKGREADPMAKYCASKVFAERAAWSFVEEYKDEVKFDLVTINAPTIFGPVLFDFHPVSAKEVGGSMSYWWNVVTGHFPNEFLVDAG